MINRTSNFRIYFLAFLGLIIAWISGVPSNAQGRFFVSTNGNDSNTGTSPANAWRTITYAASSSSPVSAGVTALIFRHW